MANIVKTVVATGVSSGLGFEAIKQLFAQPQRYNIILGARNTAQTNAAYESLKIDKAKDSLTILPLELADLNGVKTFARETLSKLGDSKIDYLLLNAALTGLATAPGPHGSKWCEPYIVNHLSQHYLVHLLKEKLVADKARIVVVSSGGIRGVSDPSLLEEQLVAGAPTNEMVIYIATKFTQLLSAHWWRHELAGQCVVVAVSPGLIPGTGLGRGVREVPKIDMTDAKSVPEGAANILRAFTRDDIPEDPEQIFLTSWGEWWPKDVYGKSLDRALQDKWSPSKEQIEKEEGITT